MAKFRHIENGRIISEITYDNLSEWEQEYYEEVNDGNFFASAIIGAATGSAIVGGLIGGDFLGGIVGDMLDGDLMD